ncbi:MAG: hypothetical protein Ct9H90mP20_7280 [Candidatus Neomarinimicrobiota bacterium]|nr:MAG: hypothetical protein Ct9H90mP20_7280 [Candidatus Neomarinimicrobiota bacterium]
MVIHSQEREHWLWRCKARSVLGGIWGQSIPYCTVLSFAISAIIIFVMMGGNLIRKDSKIPFGPYLAAGTLIALFTTTPYGGNYILNWYYTTMF